MDITLMGITLLGITLLGITALFCTCSCLAATVAPSSYYPFPQSSGQFLTGQSSISLQHLSVSNTIMSTSGSCFNCMAQAIPGNTDGSYCYT